MAHDLSRRTSLTGGLSTGYRRRICTMAAAMALVALALASVVGAPPAQGVPNRAYVANSLSGTVSVIDTTINVEVDTIDPGGFLPSDVPSPPTAPGPT